MTRSALSRIAAVIMMVAMLLAATGCSALWNTATHYNPIKGVVVSKQHTPEKTVSEMQCRWVIKTYICTPEPRLKPAKWEVTFEVTSTQGSTRDQSVSVSQKTHDSASVGQKVVYDPNTKELTLLS